MAMNGSKARKTTALVSGGAGFLGSHLCEVLLERGHRVLCVDSFITGRRENIAHLEGRRDFSLIVADICEPLKLGARPQRIYNLACAASPPRYQADPVHTLQTCVAGTLNMLQLAERSGARMLQASTSEVYGDPEEHPQREGYWGHVNCTGPRACYDEGKRAAETLCFDFLRRGSCDVRVARIFNTYGPRMHPEDGRIVSNLIVQALREEPLTVYGDGQQTRSFCYMSDMIRGLVALMEVEESPRVPVNLGNPQEFSINELAELVLRETGSSSGILHCPLPVDDPQRRRPDIASAGKLLGWEPTVPLEQGLKRTVAHFRKAELPDLEEIEAPAAVAAGDTRLLPAEAGA